MGGDVQRFGMDLNEYISLYNYTINLWKAFAPVQKELPINNAWFLPGSKRFYYSALAMVQRLFYYK
jgi:hypothetical protein